MGRGGRRRAGWSAVAGNGLLTPVYPRPLIPVDGPVVVVYSRSAGNGGQASCTQSASPVRPASCPGSIVRPRPCNSAWAWARWSSTGSRSRPSRPACAS